MPPRLIPPHSVHKPYTNLPSSSIGTTQNVLSYLVVLLDQLGGLLPLQLGEGDLLEGGLLALLALGRQGEIR